MQLTKLTSMRDGHRKVVENLLLKFEEESSNFKRIKLLEILAEKAETIKALCEKIVSHADITDLETELVESEEYSIDLELKLLTHRRQTQHASENTDLSKSDENKNRNAEAIRINEPSAPSEVMPQLYHKLPHLSLPNFNGDITKWQTFWDCYKSSVYSNHTLSDVQKFSYLRSLLHESAASSIAGFPLTNANYAKAVELLKERFGQTHKIISSYMQSLLELPRPENTPHSIQTFRDKMETFIRGLESLGQSQRPTMDATGSETSHWNGNQRVTGRRNPSVSGTSHANSILPCRKW
ncbi:uncharacterized protein LOC128230690 [Mya arenaria]|uniref:uncharacterized protein LOC128230690 n=1 Tax=Mya arenaria TaxID=6604 RepID=UPI0022E4A635|nr:uncharacterized protein LOC128230690 [Mya arenaria]